MRDSYRANQVSCHFSSFKIIPTLSCRLFANNLSLNLSHTPRTFLINEAKKLFKQRQQGASAHRPSSANIKSQAISRTAFIFRMMKSTIFCFCYSTMMMLMRRENKEGKCKFNYFSLFSSSST